MECFSAFPGDLKLKLYLSIPKVHIYDVRTCVDVAVDCPVEDTAWLMGLCEFLGDLSWGKGGWL